MLFILADKSQHFGGTVLSTKIQVPHPN